MPGHAGAVLRCRDVHLNKLQLSSRNLTSLTEADAQALGGGYGAPAEPAATAVAFSSNGSVRGAPPLPRCHSFPVKGWSAAALRG